MDTVTGEIISAYYDEEKFNQRVQQAFNSFPGLNNTNQTYYAIHQYLNTLIPKVKEIEIRLNRRIELLELLKKPANFNIDDNTTQHETKELIHSVVITYDEIAVLIKLINHYYELTDKSKLALTITDDNSDIIYNYQLNTNLVSNTLPFIENSNRDNIFKHYRALNYQLTLKIKNSQLLEKLIKLRDYFFVNYENGIPKQEPLKFSWSFQDNLYQVSFLIISQLFLEERAAKKIENDSYLNDPKNTILTQVPDHVNSVALDFSKLPLFKLKTQDHNHTLKTLNPNNHATEKPILSTTNKGTNKAINHRRNQRNHHQKSDFHSPSSPHDSSYNSNSPDRQYQDWVSNSLDEQDNDNNSFTNY
jgi:hypothetical protein